MLPDLFTSLASLLASFETLLACSHFLLVPGPTDPWSSAALPRPPLPSALLKSMISKVPNLTLGSNPCRIRWFSQEIVVFRDDLMGRMMRNAVRFPTEEGGRAGGRKGDLRKAVSPDDCGRAGGGWGSALLAKTDRERFLLPAMVQLVQTVLDQAHLAPLPISVRPVLWDYDHALRLYPMPTTVSTAA